MNISYFDLLAGSDISFYSKFNIRFPKVKELKRGNEFGENNYYAYISLLKLSKDEIVDYISKFVKTEDRIIEKLKNDKLSSFDVLSFFPSLLELYTTSLDFFIVEKVESDFDNSRIVVRSQDDGSIKCFIDRSNYEEIRRCILDMNYISADKKEAPTKYSSDKAKETWERIREYQEKFGEPRKGNDEKYSMANVISKLCAIHPSYNILNVYELTIYQLYDAFFQCSFLKQTEFSSRVFSIHGGDNFDFEEWLRPLFNKK